jgi:putative transposase
MTDKFDFNEALKAIQSGQAISGKDGVLAPLLKQLTEAALEAELDSHLVDDIESKILSMYGRGLSYSDIREHVQEIYGISVSAAAISAITDKIIDTVKDWQQRPLDSHYPFVWLDAIHYKARAQGHYQSRAVYTVLGLNLEGRKEVLGLYLADSEGANFWLGVLSNLQNRGTQDILICNNAGVEGKYHWNQTVRLKVEVDPALITQLF